MRLEFCVEDWEQASDITAEEQASRLKAQFPQMTIDRDEGNAYVQRRLDELIAMGTPDVILDAHRNYFGNVIFVLIAGNSWHGAFARSYLHTISPPLGDVVCFEIDGEPDTITSNQIVEELSQALCMEPCN